MAKLNKTNSGLLFKDDFTEKTLMWTLSPSDANNIFFGDSGLQMKHNKRYVTYTIVEPSVDEYSCIVKIDHIPANYDDIAGVLVMSTVKDYAECQTFLATGPSELVNSEQVNLDIENMIKDAITDNVVTYSIDADNAIDGNTQAPTSSSTHIHGASVDTDAPFVDKIYRYIKFTKNKYKYMFWASEDGNEWIEVGNVKFDNSGVIGFFIYGTEDKEILDNSHCFFKSFVLYNSKYITFEGIDRKYEVEIFDENGNIIMRTDDTKYMYNINRSNKQILFNSTSTSLPIKNGILRIFPKNNYEQTISQFNLGEEVYGGDGFTLERDIRLFIDKTELKPTELYDLGTFYRGSYFVKIDVYNNEDYILHDVTLKVLKYSEYYGGEEEIALALHLEGKSESELVYSKRVIIPEIKPSESKSVFMKLMDKPSQGLFDTGNAYRFKILIE